MCVESNYWRYKRNIKKMHGHSERKKEREPISYINHTYPVNQIKKLKGTL